MTIAESSPKIVEHTVGKGEIACHEQYLLFSTVFSKDFNGRHVKTRACSGKGKPYSKQSLILKTIGRTPFENIMGKRKTCW